MVFLDSNRISVRQFENANVYQSDADVTYPFYIRIIGGADDLVYQRSTDKSNWTTFYTHVGRMTGLSSGVNMNVLHADPMNGDQIIVEYQ